MLLAHIVASVKLTQVSVGLEAQLEVGIKSPQPPIISVGLALGQQAADVSMPGLAKGEIPASRSAGHPWRHSTRIQKVKIP